MTDKKKGKQGFASMDPALRREIASRGGKAARASGRAHSFTKEEAAAAGRKGGTVAHQRGTAHQWTKEAARAAGIKSGQAKRRLSHGKETETRD